MRCGIPVFLVARAVLSLARKSHLRAASQACFFFIKCKSGSRHCPVRFWPTSSSKGALASPIFFNMLTCKSGALFVGKFCRSSPKPAETLTRIRRPRSHVTRKKTQGFARSCQDTSFGDLVDLLQNSLPACFARWMQQWWTRSPRTNGTRLACAPCRRGSDFPALLQN